MGEPEVVIRYNRTKARDVCNMCRPAVITEENAKPDTQDKDDAQRVDNGISARAKQDFSRSRRNQEVQSPDQAMRERPPNLHCGGDWAAPESTGLIMLNLIQGHLTVH